MTKQNSTDYEPTEKEKNLLEVLLNPDYRMKSITDICKAAKCSRNIYYDAFGKPGFIDLYKKQSVDLVKRAVASIINTFIREAQRGSFPHGKVLLEMAGLYTEKMEHSGSIDISDKSKLIEEYLKSDGNDQT